MVRIGTIEVNAIEGRNFRSCETFSKNDPYLTYKLGDSRGRTSTHRNGGSNPQWNEKAILVVSEDSSYIRLRAYDEDLIGKDLIGEGVVDVKKLMEVGEMDAWFPIYHEKEPAGEVYLELTFKI